MSEALVVEQPAPSKRSWSTPRLDAKPVERQRAVRADHPVTRHDDRDRVAPVRRTDRPRLAAVAETLGLFAVGDRFAVRNRPQRRPRPALEGRSDGIERHVERAPSALEVLVELLGRLVDDRPFGSSRGLVRPRRRLVERDARHASRVVDRPQHGAQPARRRDQGERPDRRRQHHSARHAQLVMMWSSPGALRDGPRCDGQRRTATVTSHSDRAAHRSRPRADRDRDEHRGPR